MYVCACVVCVYKTAHVFKKTRCNCILSGMPLKFVELLTNLSCSISSTENDVNVLLAKAWNAIDWLLIICKSDQSDKIKQGFFEAVAVSILLHGYTT